jgi:hypothetical protein
MLREAATTSSIYSGLGSSLRQGGGGACDVLLSLDTIMSRLSLLGYGVIGIGPCNQTGPNPRNVLGGERNMLTRVEAGPTRTRRILTHFLAILSILF